MGMPVEARRERPRPRPPGLPYLLRRGQAPEGGLGTAGGLYASIGSTVSPASTPAGACHARGSSAADAGRSNTEVTYSCSRRAAIAARRSASRSSVRSRADGGPAAPPELLGPRPRPFDRARPARRLRLRDTPVPAARPPYAAHRPHLHAAVARGGREPTAASGITRPAPGRRRGGIGRRPAAFGRRRDPGPLEPGLDRAHGARRPRPDVPGGSGERPPRPGRGGRLPAPRPDVGLRLRARG